MRNRSYYILGVCAVLVRLAVNRGSADTFVRQDNCATHDAIRCSLSVG